MLEQLRELAQREGASIMGVAPVERFAGAPRGHHPRDFIPKARSVIVFGVGLLPALVNWQDLMADSEVFTDERVRNTVGQNYLYTNCAGEIPDQLLELLALRAAMLLQGNGHKTIYFPATYGLKFIGLREVMPDIFAPFSHRHAAVRAGLAEFGLNNLVITPQFGPRCRFTSVITEAELPPSPLLQEKVCLGEACSLCIEACPGNAITLTVAANEGELLMDPASRTNKVLCQATTREKFCRGVCIKSCPVGQDGW